MRIVIIRVCYWRCRILRTIESIRIGCLSRREFSRWPVAFGVKCTWPMDQSYVVRASRKYIGSIVRSDRNAKA